MSFKVPLKHFYRQRYYLKTNNFRTIMEESGQTSSTPRPAINQPLKFTIVAECSSSKARTSVMELPHYTVELPMFMPVGTQGSLKGLLPRQIKDAGAQIILGNTYHLGTRPGPDLFDQTGGLHNFMKWDRALLTDSGGFQMVSLLKLAKITEEGVKFQSPFDGSECMLTPEESINIQNSIGADIMMQLDDVVDVRETDYARFKVATERTTRWLDRCIKANKNPDTQNLFPIIQGGLFPDLRKKSLEMLIARDANGYAIGGLSGGEDKNKFWPTVNLCTDHLPKTKPRYCMGVGFAVDLVVCCALGVDMFDCVYPTRTARFGCALVDGGQINLKSKQYKFDFTPIDAKCKCSTCAKYTKAYLNMIITKEAVACHLVSVHNITYLLSLMKDIRESIKEDRFVIFVQDFMKREYPNEDYPQWVVDALNCVNISLAEKGYRCVMKKDENKLSKAADIFSDETWDESEDDKIYISRMSDFERRGYDNGYREGILDDYDDVVQEGRVKGYQEALRLSGIMEQHSQSSNNGTINPDSSASSITREEFDNRTSDSVILCNKNPAWLLSNWLGILMACQCGAKLKEDEIKDITILKTRLRELSSKYSAFIKTLGEGLDSLSIDGDCLSETYSGVSPADYLSCITDCETFCDRVDWKYPNRNQDIIFKKLTN